MTMSIPPGWLRAIQFPLLEARLVGWDLSLKILQRKLSYAHEPSGGYC